MGVSCSCPLAVYCDLENAIESAIIKSFSLEDDEQSICFKGKGLGPKVLKSLGSGKLLVEGSDKYRSRKTQIMRSTKDSTEGNCMYQEKVIALSRSGSSMGRVPNSPSLDPSSPKHEAALKLQKVYKSFRTRRKLADCAVLIEQSWWKLLDFAELKRSSISFFDLEKHETAISRWSRARTRAAKVGKGLSKNGKARKLALQHWLEAIDPRHRYGHNLHFYYVKWLHSQSKEPFFYWLDIGEGKEVNLIEKCSRSKLQQQCIKYLGPMERKAYEVSVEDGNLLYKETGELINTTKEPMGAKWIFVLSTSRTLYIGKKKKGSFQHSSFLAGGATLAAGRIVAEKGILKAVWPHSGHYRPTPENFLDFISFLRETNVDLTNVKLDSIDDEDKGSIGKKGGVYLRNNSSEDDLDDKDQLETKENDIEGSSSNKVNSNKEETCAAIDTPKSSMPSGLNRKLTALLIPNKDDLIERLQCGNQIGELDTRSMHLESPLDGEEPLDSQLDACMEKDNTPREHDETKEEIIPKASIFKRINSHKETKSYQLGKQLSCKWSTGAGPRIGCLRDYPSELQSHALEQVNLSPRSECRSRFDFPSWASTPTGSILSRSSSRCSRTQSLPVKGPTDPSKGELIL